MTAKGALVREDEIGVWVYSGGYVARPVNPTRYKKGEKVITHHFGGTPLHGVGKSESCKKGEYLERWLGTGLICLTYRDSTKQEREKNWEWYRQTNAHYFVE